MKSDLEKGSPSLRSDSQFELETTPSSELKDPLPDTKPKSTWQRLISVLKGGGEAHGIEPVPLEERQPVTASTSLHMLLMWFSMSLATNNIIVGSMGTFVLGLSFKDAAFCAIFGNLLGVFTVGYVSTWGPISGCRTLIVGRFFMGYYPSKVCCALNVFTNLGYCMVNSVVGGQILSRVSGGHVSVLVGIVIVAGLSWVMAMFGMKIFAVYERFAWLPQLMVLCVMLGSAGPHFDFNIHTEMSQGALNAKRVTFFSLCMSIGLAWAPLAADYYVYYPPTSNAGAPLASSAVYRAKYGNNPGDLLMMAYDSLGGFGKFCAVINVFALLANNTPGAYSMSMNFQMLGDFFRTVPRPVFVTLSTAIYCGCAMGGRNQLYDVFKSFLPLIGYWVMMFFCIIVMEDVLFRRRRGYDWSSWNTSQQLPMGIAAGLAFAIGWAGAIVGMDQSYYGGPVAQLAHGADLGTWLGAGFTLVSFPPLRAVELWYMGR
ncbi:uncharacterized protein N7477_002789 [Penicillium maclennaniae]|uniref:uncharacterized protein n=1 Tax=Penicillium maclennaniae TaxID=1343394 RepID=UPI0025406B2C|nr:uncharacterized protein N7477_002789 [Penicillium maclennaniae]KAJ5677156.1 hypothetical protein N7477_002789 [Penicillium maclennaniae]